MSLGHIVTGLCNLIFLCLNPSADSHSRSGDHEESPCSASSSIVCELPTSVILEIFFKLPVNTIIRCKCVCTSWYKLISDPYFVSTYHKNPPFTAIVCSQHRTITDPLDHESFHILEIGRNGDVFRTPFTPNLPQFPENRIIGIMGSSSGLLCLVKSPQLENESRGNYISNRDSIYNNQTVCIVNPLLRECISLPNVIASEDIRDVIYGFGENKVIRLVIRCMFLDVGHEIKVFGEIFTLGIDNKWRCFDDSSIPCYIFPCGVALNGFVHWIGDNRWSGVIYAFDVASEGGGCVPLPTDLGDEPGNIVLAIWNECLCLTDNSRENQVDVWIMKQYGVVESWSRVVILKRRIPFDLRSYPLNPIATLGNGDLLMSRPYSQCLMSFDPNVRSCSKIEGSDVEGTVCFLFGFIPSFISLSRFHIRNTESVVDV